jgi:acetyl esterase
MEQLEKSSQIQISKKLQRIIALSKRISGPTDGSELSEEQISEINKRSIPNNWITRRILKKPAKKVETNTFIIPVEEGAITGYFFQRRGAQANQMTSLRPLIIYYHGGGWVWGNMDLYSFICARIASLTHAAVLSVDYRLAPQYRFPTAVEDCYNSLIWASQGARYWKVDPERIYVMGDSAGGNLAAVVSRLARDRKGPRIAGQILIYPVTDGRLKTPSMNTFKDSPSLTAREMQFFVKSYQSEPKDILNPNFSPLLSKDHSRLPPTLIITADNDPLLDDGKLYAEALASADTPVKYLECKHTVHGFLAFPSAEGTEETESAIMQFVGGRPIDQVELLTMAQLRKRNKKELQVARKSNKSFIAAGVEEG